MPKREGYRTIWVREAQWRQIKERSFSASLEAGRSVSMLEIIDRLLGKGGGKDAKPAPDHKSA